MQLATSSGPGKADCGSGGDGGSGSGGTEALLQALHGRHVAQHQRRWAGGQGCVMAAARTTTEKSSEGCSRAHLTV